ncbi:hypothetical protein V8C44DRAFT_291396 [Trichoderma aethiopicum]
MDVTSLLNSVLPPSSSGGRNEESPNHPATHQTFSPPKRQPLPWAADANWRSYRYNGQNTRLWDAGSLTGTRIDEPGSRTPARLPVSQKQTEDAIFAKNNRINQPLKTLVLGATSELPIHMAKHTIFCDEDQTCATRRTLQERFDNCVAELPATSRHKLSFSNSSFVSSDLPLSECHSRLSSVASVSGVSLSSISVPDIPLTYAKHSNFERLQADIDATEEPASPPLTEPCTVARQIRAGLTEHARRRPANSLLRLQSPEQAAFFWQDFCSDLAAGPNNHKRAASVPIVASRMTMPTSDSLNARFPAPGMTGLAMDQSVARGLPTRAEEPQPATAPVRPDKDPEHRVFRRHALKNGQADTVADWEPAGEATIRPRVQVLDQVASITPLAQLACDLMGEAPLDASMAPLDGEPRCMFVDNCQTGSQLRKAISHLFGRNKACTLRIPKQVWVYYCRKHYQRIRYRNAKTYPLNQMYLVKMQINRLQRWSDENQRRGVGPYIKMWTLALRKREQSRLDQETGAADEGGGDNAPETTTGSAAPGWIIERLGSEYTTKDMLAIADQLYTEIENGILGQVPEVEFLPDITESEAGNTAKLVKSRKQGRIIAAPVEAKTYKRRMSDTTDAIDHRGSLLPNQYDGVGSAALSRKRVCGSSPEAGHYRPPLQVPLPSITNYANNRVPASAVDGQSVMPRALPAVPKLQMQMPPPSRSQGPVAHMYGPSSSEFRRSYAPSGLYNHDHQQQYPAQYRIGAESPLQRNRDVHNQLRLPSISAHLAGTSNTQDPNLAMPWGLVSDGTNIPRPPRLRSYSDNVPSIQPILDYPRPVSSSGAPQPGLMCSDDRGSIPSTNAPDYRGYPHGHWPESTSALGWGQRPGTRQQIHYYDQVTRPQLDSLRAANHQGPVRLRNAAESGEDAAHRYGNTWIPTEQSASKAAREGRED